MGESLLSDNLVHARQIVVAVAVQTVLEQGWRGSEEKVCEIIDSAKRVLVIGIAPGPQALAGSTLTNSSEGSTYKAGHVKAHGLDYSVRRSGGGCLACT